MLRRRQDTSNLISKKTPRFKEAYGGEVLPRQELVLKKKSWREFFYELTDLCGMAIASNNVLLTGRGDKFRQRTTTSVPNKS